MLHGVRPLEIAFRGFRKTLERVNFRAGPRRLYQGTEPDRAMDSFRCIQASRLLLDYQLHGTGPLAAELRRIVEDATLTAFERVIDQCLAHKVDCLLISVGVPPLGGGPVSDAGDVERHSPAEAGTPATPTLRGTAALVRGIARLQEPDIAVVIRPGRFDLRDHWPAGLRFPPNVQFLDAQNSAPPEDGTAAAISREGRLLATIRNVDHSDPTSATSTGWRIDLPLAGETPKTVHLAEDLRGTQGIRPSETGPRGCTLVEIDDRGESRETFLPVAPVRWEHFEVKVASETTRDDLLQEMASLLEQSARNECEEVWLVGWDLAGEGPLLESLQEPSFRERFLADLSGLEPIPHARLHTYCLRLSGARSTAPADALAADCGARLHERFANRETALAECLAGSALVGGPWEVRLESLFAELDAGEVAHDACRMAMQWFAGREELSS